MEFNRLFRLYQKYIIKVYDHDDKRIIRFAKLMIIIQLVILLVSVVLLQFKVNIGIMGLAFNIIIGLAEIKVIRLEGKRENFTQAYEEKICKRNILMFSLLSETKVDLYDGMRRQELLTLINSTYLGEKGYLKILDKVVSILAGGGVITLLLPELFNKTNYLFEKIHSEYILLIISIALVLVYIYLIEIFYKSELGQKCYFKRDLEDVICFYERAGTQYKEYVDEYTKVTKISRENTSLKELSQNILKEP